MLPLSMIWGYRCCLFLRYGGIDVASFYDMGESMLPLCTIMIHLYLISGIVPTAWYVLFILLQQQKVAIFFISFYNFLDIY